MTRKKTIPPGFTQVTRSDTIIRDPRRSPRRSDAVIIGNDILTVEFVNDMGPSLHLVGYKTTGPQGQAVVELTEWQRMCESADGAIDSTKSFD